MLQVPYLQHEYALTHFVQHPDKPPKEEHWSKLFAQSTNGGNSIFHVNKVYNEVSQQEKQMIYTYGSEKSGNVKIKMDAFS